jgi:Icc-related predicted phosphoesterase
MFNINSIFKRKNYEDVLYKKYGTANKIQRYNLKLLFIADTHNCLKDGNEILKYIQEQKDYDYCILLGDHSASDIEEILKVIPLNKICGILGNHDSWNKYDIYGITNISGKVIDIKGIRIAGISGGHKYKNSNEYVLYTHEESIQIANNIEKADILITHDKPFIQDNHNSAHDGLKGITEYIYKNHIALHIHGHLHENKEEILRNGTKSICLYMAKLLEL